MRCCAPCKPSSPPSRSFTDLSATSKRSVSTGSALRRADTAKAAFHSEGDREVALTPSSRSYIGADLSAVIAGRDPAIHPLERSVFFSMDARVEPGHDELRANGRGCYSAAMRTSGAAERTSASTCFSYLTKFSWNMRTSLRAVWSNAALSFQVFIG